MCGLAGIVAWEGRFRVTREILARMSACIAHRGPDGEGAMLTHEAEPTPDRPQAGMVHRRLAVIDPDPRANQPFVDARRLSLVYNGEIYNFPELRVELSRLRPQYRWRTYCDTEVLLVAYDVWGDRCVDYLNGMYAFAVWDSAERRLFLARDRMGQKPLYYAIAPSKLTHSVGVTGISPRAVVPLGAVAFASELSALRAVPWVDSGVLDEAITDYLCWGYVPAPRTIYRGAVKLPPACRLALSRDDTQYQRYFEPNRLPPTEEELRAQKEARSRSQLDEQDTPKPKPIHPADRTRELVTLAVNRQLVSDVPLGCFLSGGIDSSIVAAAMKASVPKDQPVLTFAIGFDDPRYDETAHAEAVAKHLGTRHHRFVVRPNAAEDLPKLAAVFAEPFGDSSALPTHYLSRETRRLVKVALSGDGGDELFGGYDRYRAVEVAIRVRRMPRFLRTMITSGVWKRLPGHHPKGRSARIKRFMATAGLPAAVGYAEFLRLFDDTQLERLLEDELLGHVQHSRNWLLNQAEALFGKLEPVQAALAVDRVTYLPEDLLTKVDRASMLHALEVRSPFMDHDLVSFAAEINTEDLLGGAGKHGKRLLREAFSGDLPAEVFRRPKMGFAVPIGDWLRGQLRPMLHDLVLGPSSFASSHFRMPAVQRLVEDHEQQKADHSQRLYALLMMELWWRAARSSVPAAAVLAIQPQR